MTRVLVTNDDGIAAPGLRWLAAAAVGAGMDVVVAAPAREASGASAGLSARYVEGRLAIARAELSDLDTEAYCVHASPSFIVILATLGTFGARPDLVLSGINRGANAGHAVLHSGTVGAAMTAANQGVRAMAVSLDVLTAAAADPARGGATLTDLIDRVADEELHWSTACDVARELLPRLVGLPRHVVLNVNVPNRASVGGVRQATLAPFGQVQMAIAEAGEDFVRIALEANDDRRAPGTDVALLGDGYATVTPIAALRALDLDLVL